MVAPNAADASEEPRPGAARRADAVPPVGSVAGDALLAVLLAKAGDDGRRVVEVSGTAAADVAVW